MRGLQGWSSCSDDRMQRALCLVGKSLSLHCWFAGSPAVPSRTSHCLCILCIPTAFLSLCLSPSSLQEQADIVPAVSHPPPLMLAPVTALSLHRRGGKSCCRCARAHLPVWAGPRS